MTRRKPGLTTSRYWDCECEMNYIRPRSARRCPQCGARRDDSPDARRVEVAQYELLAQIESQMGDRLQEIGVDDARVLGRAFDAIMEIDRYGMAASLLSAVGFRPDELGKTKEFIFVAMLVAAKHGLGGTNEQSG